MNDKRLNPIQEEAMNYAIKKSRLYGKNTLFDRKIRFIRLGYNEEIMVKTIDYLKHHVEITINVAFVTIFTFLIKDTHYKNQFETNTSKGSLSPVCRTQWETKLFNGIYNKSVVNKDRVKYGAINIYNDLSGNSSTLAYGDCFFVLKHDVRSRCTISVGDSSEMNIDIGTFHHPEIILTLITDRMLECLIEKNILNKDIKSINSYYLEVQIHGDIILAKDIESLNIPKTYKTSEHKNIINEMNQIIKYCSNNGILLYYF